MDLRKALADHEWMKTLIKGAYRELSTMSDTKVTHSLFVGNELTTEEAAPAKGSMKPMSIAEFYRGYESAISHEAVVGSCFSGWETCQTWELQYMVFFLVYASSSLRAFLSEGSPLIITHEFLEPFKYIYEAHISGASISPAEKGRGDSVLIVPKSALEFTVQQMLSVYSLYNATR